MLEKVLLIGGGARSRSLPQAAATIFGLPVEVPASWEYVALGATRQTAWAASGDYPDWKRIIEASINLLGIGALRPVAGHINARRSTYGALPSVLVFSASSL